MSDTVTSQQLDSALRTQTEEIVGILQSFMQQTSDEFEKINNRLDGLDQKYDRLVSTIDGFVSRIDKYETELAARDNQIEKLISWARKVSEKTGIPLENL